MCADFNWCSHGMLMTTAVFCHVLPHCQTLSGTISKPGRINHPYFFFVTEFPLILILLLYDHVDFLFMNNAFPGYGLITPLNSLHSA